MPQINIRFRSGQECKVEGVSGQSLMEVIRAETSDLLALCGGACSCATCHVFVDPQWTEALPPMSDGEDGLLDGCSHRNPYSRLSCQIAINERLDGLRVEIAPEE